MSVGVEGAVLHQQRAGLPAAHQRKPRAGIGDARSLQRDDGRGEELERIARRQRDPARDRQQAAGLQMPQVVLQRLDRVEVVLRQRVQAGRRRAEGIEQRDLDQVVALRRWRRRSRAPRPRARARCRDRCRPHSRRSARRTRSTTCGLSSTASICARAVVVGLQHVGARRRRPAPARAACAAGGRAAPSVIWSRCARLSRRPSNRVSAFRPSPSMKTPSCGGGSVDALRLSPGAWRSGMRGLSTTLTRPERARSLLASRARRECAASATAPCTATSTGAIQADGNSSEQRRASASSSAAGQRRPAAAFEPRHGRGQPARARRSASAHRPAPARTAAPRRRGCPRPRPGCRSCRCAARMPRKRDSAMHTQAPAHRKGSSSSR